MSASARLALKMMKILFPRTLGLLLFLSTGFVHADVLPPVQDSSSLKGKLTAVTGKASTLAVSASRTGYVLFNIQSLPAQLRSNEIKNARLRVYFPKVAKPGDIAIHTVLPVGPLWSETATTLAPGVSGTPIAMLPTATVVGKKFVEVDVTATVQAWHSLPGDNYGFAFIASGVTNVLLGAKEGPGSGYPAELDIEISRTVFPAVGSIGTDEIEDASVSNAKLASPSLTINAGTGLTGGGAVSLGGNTTLSLGTNLTLGGTTSGTFSGNGAALTGIVGANIAAGSVGNSQLAAGAAAANLNANGQSGVPSGGLVLSATDPNVALTDAGYVKLGVTATSDSWLKRSESSAPSMRNQHVAVWTGTEMIIWGGFNGDALGDGARYNPKTNNWVPLNPTGAPAARYVHTAVWTGNKMLVWGGRGAGFLFLNSGGSFDPAANSWTDITLAGAPSSRWFHTAIWTGTEMIVWGGQSGATYFNTGARYSPATNMWTALNTVGAPSARSYHTAVWTGSEMIIWGGGNAVSLNDGARYNPTTNTWSAMSGAGAPSARASFRAIWSGSEMIIWGGNNNGNALADGARYNPGTNTWATLSDVGSPAARYSHTAIWTGSEMMIWGGFSSGGLNNGARYTPATNSWAAMSSIATPPARSSHSAVWTDSEMIIFGGSDVGPIFHGDTFSYTLGRTLYLYQRP